VISEHPLSQLVPVENAAMPDRTIIQWDKDDLDTLGLLKVDCLALGMLSCIRRCLDLVNDWARRTGSQPPESELSLASIPAEDSATYQMLQRGDSVGVFQVESRAQMAMLPRLKPKNFYDLVIEVAIVRPGPIQGKMVHPYLRRRQGLETVSYPSEDLKRVFERTLGVPIFQEQVMQLAIVAAGFTPGEADELRRAMAAWKRRGGLAHYRQRIIEGMTARGYEVGFAEQVFEQIKGFGSYGFPESHAASFALLVYASAWLKCHHPAAFAAALINAQPLGFYSVDQIVQDARRHGVEVRPVDVRCSLVDAHLEPGKRGPALRLGLRTIRGLPAEAAARIVAARKDAPYRDVEDLAHRAAVGRPVLRILAAAGALRSLAGHRHRAHWAAAAVEAATPLLGAARIQDEPVTLRPPNAAENVLADYATLGLTLDAHPLRLLRGRLRAAGWRSIRDALAAAHGTPLRSAGLVRLRQRPGTASGVMFLTLEDESGWLNVIVWPQLVETQRRELLESQMLGVIGELQTAEGVTHLLAQRLVDLSDWLGGLDARSRDFH
jgi:error-prone DNA polymerase